MPKKNIAITAIIILNIAVVLLLLASNSGEFEYNKEMELPFKSKASTTTIAVYLGFVGCPSVCPTALSKIADLQDEIEDNHFQFIFVNLIDGVDKSLVQEYAESFHPNFKGVQLSPQDKQALIEKLHAFYAEKQETVGRETAHSDYVYFFNKISNSSSKWILKYVITPSNVEILLKTYQNTKTHD